MQTKLTYGKLLNEKGELNQAGYAYSLVKEYNRNDIKANKMRIKEWDYYLIQGNRYNIALTIDDAIVLEYRDNKPILPTSPDPPPSDDTLKVPRRGRFKFSMVGIKIGEMVTFTPTGTDVKVASDDSVEYEGRIYKLSPFVGTFMPEDRRNTSGAYQGAKYFSYKGKILDDLRTECEQSEYELI